MRAASGFIVAGGEFSLSRKKENPIFFGNMLKEDSPRLETREEGVKIPKKVRKFFSGYFSIGMLLGSLGFGMARGAEKDKPVYISQQPGKQTTMVLSDAFSLASQLQSLKQQLKRLRCSPRQMHL